MRRSNAKRDKDDAALRSIRSRAAKKRPTKSHRPALWENMLGTVYAMNAAGVVAYFDYDYAQAVAFIGVAEDVRVHRVGARDRFYIGPNELLRRGKLVWFVKKENANG